MILNKYKKLTDKELEELDRLIIINDKSGGIPDQEQKRIYNEKMKSAIYFEYIEIAHLIAKEKRKNPAEITVKEILAYDNKKYVSEKKIKRLFVNFSQLKKEAFGDGYLKLSTVIDIDVDEKSVSGRVSLSKKDVDRYRELLDKYLNGSLSNEEESEFELLYEAGIRKEIKREFLIAAGHYANITGSHNHNITKQFLFEHCSKNKYNYLTHPYVLDEFGGITGFKDIVFAHLSSATDDYVDFSKERNKIRTYVVSAVVPNQNLDIEFVEALKLYCKENNAEFLALPTVGVHSKDTFFDERIYTYADHFANEFVFNKNVKAVDFSIKPQQIIPTTGINRLGHKTTSLIIPATKISFEVEPVANSGHPHIIHATGCLTVPEHYTRTRIGAIAKEDHKRSALVIEVENDLFHVRQLIWNDEQKQFFDINRKYTSSGSFDYKMAAFVFPDLHFGSHDPHVVNIWYEIMRLTQPDYCMIHDAFDGISINHHAEGDYYFYQNHIPKHLKTLPLEIDAFSVFVKDMVENRLPEHTKAMMVASNHPEWLINYLKYGKYAKADSERENHALSLELALHMIRDKMNPFEYYLKSRYPGQHNDRIVWMTRDQDFYIGGRQLGVHGDKGIGGSRGSIKTHERNYGKSITGHTHRPGINREAVVVGTSTYTSLTYTVGTPSTWMNTCAITDEFGYYQLISVINKKYRSKKNL